MPQRRRDWIGATVLGLAPEDGSAAQRALDRAAKSRDFKKEALRSARYEELRKLTDKELTQLTGITAARSVMLAAAMMRD
jgi:hypothetical protein